MKKSIVIALALMFSAGIAQAAITIEAVNWSSYLVQLKFYTTKFGEVPGSPVYPFQEIYQLPPKTRTKITFEISIGGLFVNCHPMFCKKDLAKCTEEDFKGYRAILAIGDKVKNNDLVIFDAGNVFFRGLPGIPTQNTLMTENPTIKHVIVDYHNAAVGVAVKDKTKSLSDAKLKN